MDDDTPHGEPAASRASQDSEDLSDLSLDALLDLEEDLAAQATAEGGIDRARRLAVDARIVERLRAEGFLGPRYERLTQQLMEYALATMIKWNANGLIFVKSRRVSRPVPGEKITFAWNNQERRDVALDTVVSGHDLFREHGLIRGRWNPAQGACLTTYFVGAAVLAFRPVYLSWYDARQRMHAALQEAVGTEQSEDWLANIPDQRSADAFDDAALWDQIARLNIADPQTREGLYYYAQGFTQRDAALKAGLSPRALEGRIKRLRDKLGTDLDDAVDDLDAHPREEEIQ
ncbi:MULTISPECIES: hypothetical protein [unclassified Streptomyces]|uniref:hypothetical protein n=1 Tax=unclassified Streptomyces TaxID=2593676 RepID=UPI002255235B|nr:MULTISPECIES: hypothetical protein [unclassified Streptomyces]MCX5327930.1 hypothetical protein [Streptomyces sp. NBC_00140]MCX5357420.1 hypothetical protein [Streptomyces sp. NBC_00124]